MNSGHYICRLVVALVGGLAAGLTLPHDLPPPERVITHAFVRSNTFDRSMVVAVDRPTETDVDLFEALDVLDEHPQLLLGRRIAVAGSWHPRDGAALAAVSRRLMACCAADALDLGFDVLPLHAFVAQAGTPVRVRGLVQAWLHDGETRYVLTQANVEKL